ncbi:DUF2141 domain-containing protein [Brevundimonas sp.]|uniref:DUF2141 domain-containing protein n=1 Tax=Brevundimonas sp. TaxID=1871086 RepID=UPI0035660945
MIRFAATTAFALMLGASAASAEPAGDTLTLTFETGATTGTVMISVFNSEATYSSGAPVAATALSASGPVVAVFENLPAGDYAVKAFHDVNGNGRMDTNPFGMPVEPYAFSNNARGNMGPAGWDRAHFAVSGATAQTISVR